MRRATLLVAALLIAAPAWGVTIEELPNGARLVAIQSPSTYASGFAVLVDADPSDEGYLPGLRALLARASLSGVEGTDPRQVLERLQAVSLIGGQVTTFADDDAMVMGVSGPPEIAENALGILSDALLRPSFTQPALDAAVRETIDDAERQGGDRFYSLLSQVRGVLHPVVPATSPVGTVSGLRAATVEDLQAAHKRLMVGSRVVCVAVGPGPESEMLDSLRSVAAPLPPGEAKPPATPTWEPASPIWRTHVTEDHEGRLALLLMAFGVPNTGSDAWPAVEMLREMLGGPAGRLTRSPRLLQYAPTVQVFLIPRTRYSELVILAATPMAWRLEALRLEVFDCLEELAAEPLARPEVEAARRRLLGGYALRHQPVLGRAIEVGRTVMSGGDVEAAAHHPLEGLRQVTAEETQAIARSYLGAERAALAVALPASPALDELAPPAATEPAAEGT